MVHMHIKKERHLGVLKERGEYVYYVRHLRTLILRNILILYFKEFRKLDRFQS